MSASHLRRIVALASVLERAERAAAAEAAQAQDELDAARAEARHAAARSASAHARSGELATFLQSRRHGAALAGAAAHQASLVTGAADAAAAAMTRLTGERVRLAAVRRIADARAAEIAATQQRVIDDVVAGSAIAKHLRQRAALSRTA